MLLNIIPNCGYETNLTPLNGETSLIYSEKMGISRKSADSCYHMREDKPEYERQYKKFQKYYQEAQEACYQSTSTKLRATSPETYGYVSQACDNYKANPLGYHKRTEEECKSAKDNLSKAKNLCNSAYNNAQMQYCKFFGSESLITDASLKCTNKVPQ